MVTGRWRQRGFAGNSRFTKHSIARYSTPALWRALTPAVFFSLEKGRFWVAQKNKMGFYYLFLTYKEVTETFEEIEAETYPRSRSETLLDF